jgi:hypothetical protein
VTAEQRVHDVLRAALPAEYRLYPNVRWILKRSAQAPARDGETDLVIVHPEHGLLIVETKGGRIRRDGQGRWWSGEHAIDPPPFKQSEDSKHAIAAYLTSLPDWPGRPGELRRGHAVAFPDVAVDRAHAQALGPDAPREIVFAEADLATPGDVRKAVARAYGHWVGDGRRGRPLSAVELAIAHESLGPTPTQLEPLLRRQIEEGEQAVVTLTRSQLHVLDMLRGRRRAAVVGPAGCGKTMLAAEKARRLAREGFATLLVCFNQPLARMLADQLAEVPAPGGLQVSTFHELCLRLGREAGTLPDPEPARKDQDWFDRVLPGALDAAIDGLGPRFHAVVVDEGQDFARSWLESLQLLLHDPGGDVFYVFHDPAQALYRDDEVGSLGLDEFPVEWNCRNPRPIHDFAARYAAGLGEVEVLREAGRAPEVIQAAPGRETIERLRKVLHRLAVEERVAPWRIAVLTGGSLAKSEVWRQRRFGDQVLWNGAYDDAGISLGLPADQVPEQPTDTILCDSIRRFKGLEREVVVLVEVDPEDPRVGQLLYVGATRARQHLIVIAAVSP